MDLVLYDEHGQELSCNVHEDYIDRDMVLSFSAPKDLSAASDIHTFYVHANVLEQSQERSGEKPSLSAQICQAEARATPTNAEKETHNFGQER